MKPALETNISKGCAELSRTRKKGRVGINQLTGCNESKYTAKTGQQIPLDMLRNGKILNGRKNGLVIGLKFQNHLSWCFYGDTGSRNDEQRGCHDP
jgi:hypothetical protein